MKKMKLTSKKVLSVFLAVLMIMSAWVFVAPVEKAHAAQEILNYELEDLYNTYLTEASGATFVKGKFTNDDTVPAPDGHYVNVLYSPAYTQTDIYSGVASAGQTLGSDSGCTGGSNIMDVDWHHAETVMLYDGDTTPQTGVMVTTDPNCTGSWDGNSTVYKVWMTNDDLAHPSYWKGICGENLDFTWAMTQGDQLNYLEKVTDESKAISRKNSDKVPVYANYIQYIGTMEETEFLKTIFPSFSLAVRDDKVDATISATSTSAIRVVNYKPLKDTIKAAKKYIAENIFSDANKEVYSVKYTEASLNKLRELANALVAAKPDTTYFNGDSKCKYDDYAADAKAAVEAWNKWVDEGGLELTTSDVLFDNLIDFRKWNTTTASNATISNVGNGGFTLTSNSGVGEGSSSSPFFPVEPGKEYMVDIDIEGKNWDVYIFFCDANGTGVDFVDGEGTKYSSDTTWDSIFTAPNKSNVVQAQIRVDANGSNNAVTFKEIRVYEKGKVDSGVSYIDPITLEYGQSYEFPAEPTKDCYEFSNWTDAEGNVVTSSSTIATNKPHVLYSKWKNPNHTPGQAKTENNVDSTCTVQGPYELAVYCEVCGIELSREHKLNELKDHKFTKEAALRENGKYLDDYLISEATCNKLAEYYMACSDCGASAIDDLFASSHTFTYGDLDYTKHVLAKVEAQEATCFADGKIAHWNCSVCHNNYLSIEDAEAGRIAEKVTENKKEHQVITVPGKPATCKEPGYSEYNECALCRTRLSQPEQYPRLEHVDKTGPNGTPDHKCDYNCGTSLGDHLDEDYDHDCDYCGKLDYEEFGPHEDNDTDHYCDYCEQTDDAFGPHEDKTGPNGKPDHECDYGCEVAIGICEDKDNDHKCDHGCEVYYGEHIDDDFDHKCDYGCKVEDFGTHEDKDKDHECDYGCNVTIGECKDSNYDHECDYGCAKVFGTCQDNNSNHKCDYAEGYEGDDGCKKVYGEHKDADDDTDHECDYCGEDGLTDCIPGDIVIENEVKATCETAGSYDEVTYCTVCGEECSREKVTVDALTHGWTVKYEWVDVEDGKLCIATRVCANDTTHNETEEVKATSEVTLLPSCGKRGETTYTADFTVEWAEDQTKVLDDLDPACEDADKDHYCDKNPNNPDHYVGVHGDKTGPDGKPDHKCEYCNKEDFITWPCVDADFDHYCDHGCGAYFGEHKDTNKDHICDYGCAVRFGGDCYDSENDEDHKCDYCGKDNMNAHVAGAEHKENEVAPTCSTKGSYDLVIRCSVCNAVLSTKKVIIDTLPHTWKSEIEYGFNEKTEEFTATRTCDVCGGTETVSKKATVTVKVEATCNNAGEKLYTAENIADWAPKAQSKTVVVPKLEHKDENFDHWCDNGCGNYTGVCEDGNFDHYCDYGVNCEENPFGNHEDVNKDHRCEYCRKYDENKFSKHEWKEHSEFDTLKSAATCMSPAIYNNVCAYCGKIVDGGTHKYGPEDTVNGHSFGGKAVAADKDKHAIKCTVPGCKEIKYVDCSYETTKEVAATCKSTGYKVEKCSICRKTKRTTLEIDSTNHAGGTEARDAIAATCVKDGYTGDVYCLGCNTKIADGTTIAHNPNLHPHENMKDYAKVDSTCTKVGYEAYRYCDKCDTYAVNKVEIPVKGHDYTDYTSNGDGTHSAVCKDCPAVAENIACSGGIANCVEAKKCEFCNTAYGEKDESNHKSRVTVAKKEATCQTEGNYAYIRCGACGDPLEEIVKTPKKEHIYGEWTKVEGTNEHKHTCLTCDKKIGEVASETENCYGGYAYCNQLATCEGCKSKYGSFSTDPSHHKSTVTTIVGAKAATCCEKGYTGDEYYICCYNASKPIADNASAFAKKGQETQVVDHVYDILVSETASTCQEKGVKVYKCSTCPENGAKTLTKTLDIDPNNHQIEAAIKIGVKEATCIEDGFTGNEYYPCCYDSTKSDDENRIARKSKGTVIKANGEHTYSDAYPEFAIDKIVESKDEDGNVVSREIVLVTEMPTYEEMVAARRADGFWYHIQVCTECYELKETRCASYTSAKATCIDTEKCVVCLGLCSLKDPKNHTKIVQIEGSPATCTENGTKDYYKCNGCKNCYFDAAGKNAITAENEDELVIVANGEHTINRETKPTANKNGTHTYICSVCNKAEIVEDCKGGADATCLNKSKCKYCGEAYGELNKLNHEKDTVETGRIEPDRCIPGVEGKVYYECCGHVKSEGTVIEATEDHDWNITTTEIVDNCAAGYTINKKCKVCEHEETETVSGGNHELVVVYETEKDCTKDRYIYYACSICTFTDKQVVGADGNTYNYISVEKIDAKSSCSWGAWKTEVKADCVNEGKRSRTCLVCGKTEYDKIAKTDHVTAVEYGYAATCDKAGKQDYAYCVVPGCPYGKGGSKYIGDLATYKQYKNSKGKTIEATGHDYDSNGYCKDCDNYSGTNVDGTNCNCVCHKQNGFMKLWFKFLNFFWKLFKINKTCCSAGVHY